MHYRMSTATASSGKTFCSRFFGTHFDHTCSPFPYPQSCGGFIDTSTAQDLSTYLPPGLSAYTFAPESRRAFRTAAGDPAIRAHVDLQQSMNSREVHRTTKFISIFWAYIYQQFLLKYKYAYSVLSDRVHVYTPAAIIILAKLGVPRPVTGSQPGAALKPLVLHPGLSPIKKHYLSMRPRASGKS